MCILINTAHSILDETIVLALTKPCQSYLQGPLLKAAWDVTLFAGWPVMIPGFVRVGFFFPFLSFFFFKDWIRSISYSPGIQDLTGRSLEQIIIQRDHILH